MRIVGAIIVVLASTPVRAEPSKQVPTCKPGGAVIVEIAQRADPGHRIVTASTKLYANGTVRTEVFDVDKKLMRASLHCLENAEMDLVRDDLKNAKWKMSPAPAPCGSSSPRLTAYIWNGASVFVERTCGPRVDVETRRTLARLSAWLRVPNLDDAVDDCANPLARGCAR